MRSPDLSLFFSYLFMLFVIRYIVHYHGPRERVDIPLSISIFSEHLDLRNTKFDGNTSIFERHDLNLGSYCNP